MVAWKALGAAGTNSHSVARSACTLPAVNLEQGSRKARGGNAGSAVFARSAGPESCSLSKLSPRSDTACLPTHVLELTRPSEGAGGGSRRGPEGALGHPSNLNGLRHAGSPHPEIKARESRAGGTGVAYCRPCWLWAVCLATPRCHRPKAPTATSEWLFWKGASLSSVSGRSKFLQNACPSYTSYLTGSA